VPKLIQNVKILLRNGFFLKISTKTNIFNGILYKFMT